MEMNEDGYYFILKGNEKELLLYQKISDEEIEIFESGGTWYMSSKEIRSKSDELQARFRAEEILDLLHGIVSYYSGVPSPIMIVGSIKNSTKKVKSYSSEIIGSVKVKKPMDESSVMNAKQLFHTAIDSQEMRLFDCLRLFRKGRPLNLADSYKVLEIVTFAKCKEILNKELFNKLKWNLNSSSLQGEQARHSIYYDTRKEDEKFLCDNKMTEKEIADVIKKIVDQWIKQWISQ